MYLTEKVMDKKKIFISFSSQKDKNKMNAFFKAIKKDGTFEPIVVEKKKTPGKLFSEKVKEAIKQSDYFIPILTRNSRTSQWVNQEIGFAEAQVKCDILPIVEESIIPKLKGFIHNQIDCFRYKGVRSSKNNEACNFRVCYKEVIAHLKGTIKSKLVVRKAKMVEKFTSMILPSRVEQGDSYTTKVHFVGTVKNGFFDNYVKHTQSDWKAWNWDKNTLKNLKRTFPGEIHGDVNIKSEYTWTTKDWPIHVRLYDHPIPGEKRRIVIAEEIHEFEVT